MQATTIRAGDDDRARHNDRAGPPRSGGPARAVGEMPFSRYIDCKPPRYAAPLCADPSDAPTSCRIDSRSDPHPIGLFPLLLRSPEHSSKIRASRSRVQVCRSSHAYVTRQSAGQVRGPRPLRGFGRAVRAAPRRRQRRRKGRADARAGALGASPSRCRSGEVDDAGRHCGGIRPVACPDQVGQVATGAAGDGRGRLIDDAGATRCRPRCRAGCRPRDRDGVDPVSRAGHDPMPGQTWHSTRSALRT